MTNFEKYKDEIVDAIDSCTLGMFIKNKLHDESYYEKDALGTYEIIKLFMWLNEEYKEPVVDWSKVEVDTLCMVRAANYTDWTYRHFAGADQDMKPRFWRDGRTSKTIRGKDDYSYWSYYKLAEEGDK